RGDSDLFLLDLEEPGDGSSHRLTPHQGPGTSAEGRLSPDGGTVYLISNQDRDLAALGRAPLDPGGRSGPIETIAARADAELEALELSEDGRTAALLWNAAGRSELTLLDPGSLETTPAPALPAEIAGGLSFTPDGRLLALTAWGSTAPADVWLLERSTGR